MNRLLPAWIVLLLALPLAACWREPVDLAARMNAAITPPPVIADWIIQGRNDFLLFDLRGAQDFARGHLPNAVQVDPARLRERGIVKALPDYKKLVFYGANDALQRDWLEPLFARGLHVLILQGGYAGWQRDVLSLPAQAATAEDARRAATARYFRGESALGRAAPAQAIPASKYLRPPQLPAPRPAPSLESEGC